MVGFLKKKEQAEQNLQEKAWKILIVDDEEAIHDITKLALKGFEFTKRGIEFYHALSAKEAKEVLNQHDDIALILLDVVMESENAGLELVTYIRQEANNKLVRIILRTGQPGQAPEKFVIDHFDINDYKEKTELTQTKLYTCVRTGIQDYVRLAELESQKEALSFLAQSAAHIFKIDSFENFFNHTLSVISKFIALVGDNKNSITKAFAVFPVDDDGGYKICISNGKYCNQDETNSVEPIVMETIKIIKQEDRPFFLEKDRFFIPMKDAEGTTAIIYVCGDFKFNAYFSDLIGLLAMQVSTSFKNIDLYEVLSKDHAETINILAVASEYKDETTGSHIKRIERMTLRLAQELGLNEQEAYKLSRAAILHDIGKIAVPDSILQKPAKLDDDELQVMRLHTSKGSSILQSDKRFALEAEIAQSHHERFDGKGYPSGLAGEAIPLSGRIVSVVDVFDALVNSRPYKDAWSGEKAIEYIKQESGKQFDPTVVDAFVKLYEKNEL